MDNAFVIDMGFAQLIYFHATRRAAKPLACCMGMLCFPRLTNASSKKLANHVHLLSLYFVYYNFVRIHESLRTTPAMAAGLCNKVQDMDWVAGLIDACATKPNRPTTYRKRISS